MKLGLWTILCGVSLIAMLGALSGCATTQQPAMKDAQLMPAKVSGGDDVLICVKVDDPKGVVDSVTATVREFPEIMFDLNDDGEQGDKVAGDGVWSFALEIPWGAPPGKYTYDFDAYDAKGDVIKVSTDEGEKALTEEATVEIEL